MIQWAIIIVIVISFVSGVYTLVLLNNLRNKYKIDFLNSLLYYQLLILIFGVYGILGNIIIHEILPMFDIIKPNIEAIAHFFPFISTPFMITAWYMIIKMTGELLQRTRPQYISVVYFLVVTAAFLIYGLSIKRMPEYNNYDYQALKQKVIIVFYSIELIIAAYIIIRVLIKGLKEKSKKKEQFVIRFALIFGIISILKAIALHFSDFHWIVGLYYMLLFFSGVIPLVFLTRTYLENNSYEYISSSNIHEDLFNRYKITKREREIITEICKGKTNKQIADELFISLQTVKDHTHNIFIKTRVKNRVQLVQRFS
ncbi:MAG: helix-turn-helix transcriptional regulator [Bacteroidota bacterium]